MQNPIIEQIWEGIFVTQCLIVGQTNVTLNMKGVINPKIKELYIFLPFFTLFWWKLSMSMVREYGTVRRTFKYGTVVLQTRTC